EASQAHPSSNADVILIVARSLRSDLSGQLHGDVISPATFVLHFEEGLFLFSMDSISTSSEIEQLTVETSSLIHADSSQCYSPSNKESWESLVFESIKEIEDFYGNYAYHTGFCIRSMLKSKNNSQNKKSDKVHDVRYVCNKQGFKKGSLLNPKNRPT
ncbi:FAR1-related protein, partial [Trifolium pratense]